jgi:hypothetical protein
MINYFSQLLTRFQNKVEWDVHSFEYPSNSQSLYNASKLRMLFSEQYYIYSDEQISFGNHFNNDLQSGNETLEN